MTHLKYDGRCTDQGGNGGGDGTAGEPELCCTLGAKGGPAVLDGGGDGASGNPELICTVGADGEPAITGGSDPEGEPDPLHTSILSWVDADPRAASRRRW